VLVHDGSKVLFGNSAAARLFGVPKPEDLVGLDIWRFVREEFKLIAVERVRRILEGQGSSSPMEQEWLRLDGTPVPIEIQGTYIPFGGKPAILAILRDITERRKTAQLLTRYERLATIGKVIAAIAHEIRNPLGVVTGMGQLLKAKLEGREEYSQELETILQHSERLKIFMNDILDYSRGMEIQKVRVDPRELFEHSLVLARAQYGPRHASLKVDWAFPEKCPTLYLDPARMEQVLSNLILNAFQALGEKGTVTLSAETRERTLVLGVADDGPGVPSSDVAKLFEPFFTTKKEGTGLGLPISQKIVEAHGGKLEVRPRSPKGSFFFAELPLA
jgi:PAS domain S-box-containing protein